MCLKPDAIPPIPAETVRIAHAAFPDGALAIQLRDALGVLYQDEQFADLFSPRGQPALAPWRLALVTILQFTEGLSDRQAAQAVRRCLDWKYALSLELTDAGFDYSALSEFRTRLIAGHAEERLLTAFLDLCHDRGWLTAGGKQRTDSTHVLAAVRALNRLELVGETLRHALNVLAEVVPNWLRQQAPPEWFDRYSHRVEEYRLPKGLAARQQYGEVVGADGMMLSQALAAADAPPWLHDLPAIQRLAQIWEQQFVQDGTRIRWRSAKELAPAGERLDSPYDPDARFGNKRSLTWTGYKAHLTETCDADTPHLITDVHTTSAQVADVAMTEPIQRALMAHGVAPATHIADAGFVDAELLVASQHQRGMTLIGPVRPNVSWQAKAGSGYDLSHFIIDWEQQQAICPQGKRSRCWVPHQDAWGNAVVSVKFSRADCRPCPVRSQCTHAKEEPRHLGLRVQANHEAIQHMRQQQQTTQWKALYDIRAGVEGTFAQANRRCDLRHARYVGGAKTHLQQVAIAVALNAIRLVAWLQGKSQATTRLSPFAALARIA